MTLAELLASTSPVEATLHVQLATLERKTTATQKPYLDVAFADGTAELKLKVWQDAASYEPLVAREPGTFVAVRGKFTKGDWGWESRDFATATLAEDEITALLEGDPERRAFLESRWVRLCQLIASVKDLALKQVASHLIAKHEALYRRAAAARGNHHARRGGLVEHVTEMTEIADGVCGALPHLNRSLLLAAIVFHDCGKMLENNYEPRGFVMPFNKGASLVGHIAIGFQLARDLWLECGLNPADDRLLLLRHLILSHHGQLDWGSPVEPMCPEAAVLHYIDQISAKTEMFKAMYLKPEIAPGLHEKGWPLNVSAVDVPPEAA